MSTDPTPGGAEAAAVEPLVIDSGPLVMHATTQPDEHDEEVRDGGDRPDAGE